MRMLAVLGLVLFGCVSSPDVPTLRVNSKVVRQWHFMFRVVRDVEWLECLNVTWSKSGIAYIQQAELADIRYADEDTVYGSCGNGVRGIAHSHPLGPPNCFLSGADLKTMPRYKLSLVVCDAGPDFIRIGFRFSGDTTNYQAVVPLDREGRIHEVPVAKGYKLVADSGQAGIEGPGGSGGQGEPGRGWPERLSAGLSR